MNQRELFADDRDPPVKGLTLWQPWATLVASGMKEVETRSWGTGYRGLLAIHAARKWDDEVMGQVEAARESVRRCWGVWFRRPEHVEAGNVPWEETLGRIVAVCTLADCRPMLLPPDPQEGLFGNYGEGRWGWVLRDVHPVLPPIPCQGNRCLWNVPDDLARVLREEASRPWRIPTIQARTEVTP